MSLILLSAIFALPSLLAGHGGVWNYSIAQGIGVLGIVPPHLIHTGNGYPGFSSIQRHWVDFRPIVDVELPTLVCNEPGSPAEESTTVATGAEIEAYYKGWPHDIGPIIVWMAYCGPDPASCSSFDGTGRSCVTIPERLKGGAYLMRHELIALHVPFTPEFYPECAHLYVLSSGDETPGEEYLASIPGVWEKDEPELHLSIYEEPTSSRTEWLIPGPAVWRGSGQ
ncbi:lytic polysaccharide monooxygenase [Chaetomidium leptoderma]|uniref:lytic cellulose monooxygenase (C4-dehydrogenating) n=1 Tax=Chaetomidium leptoderma TaxID=669021 RepID=A0AAN6VG22_9PEZI|nr:lytic polysaccharide monooxygenase [Chaetomidium leptoderma]